MSVVALIAAGGRGERYGMGLPKQFLTVSGKMVVEYSLAAFASVTSIDSIVVIAPPSLPDSALDRIFSYKKVSAVVPGGATRQKSVMSGLRALRELPEIIVVHDAARPLVSEKLIDRLIEVARKKGAAIPAVPIPDTIKFSENGNSVERTVDRENYLGAQTPQAFRGKLLMEAAEEAERSGIDCTDEAQMVENAGGRVFILEGERTNLKVTYSEDLDYFKSIVGAYTGDFRVGLGYDAHRLVSGRPLHLGGIEIESELGLLGHSDGDCALHAISDALLGSADLGDIGYYFPPEDDSIEGISSLEIAEEVVKKVRQRGFRVVNIDCVIICQKPRISDYADEMAGSISNALGIRSSSVSIKGKTTEGMGFEGAGEGISSIAVALVEKDHEEA